MALVLILAGLVPGLAAAGMLLASGAGFLAILGAYMVFGACGMGCAAGLLVLRATRAEAAGRPAPRGLVLPAP